jgi:hypothetical protein
MLKTSVRSRVKLLKELLRLRYPKKIRSRTRLVLEGKLGLDL